MYDELKKINDELVKENERLAAELNSERERCYKIKMDLLIQHAKDIARNHETVMALFDESLAIIEQQDVYMKRIKDLILPFLEIYEAQLALHQQSNVLNHRSIQIYEAMMKYDQNKIERFKKAPKVNKEKTRKFWSPYIKKFDAYITNGKDQAWAINEIGNCIKKDGLWKTKSKKDPRKIITRPNRTTIYRQLVTNRE